MLVAFCHELRGAGISVGSGDIMTYCAAVAQLDPSDLADLYWGGRSTLVTRRDQIPVYDRVFRSFYLGAGHPAAELLQLTTPSPGQTQGVLQIPATEPTQEEPGQEAKLGLMASDAETLRHKTFTACTPDELAACAGS